MNIKYDIPFKKGAYKKFENVVIDAIHRAKDYLNDLILKIPQEKFDFFYYSEVKKKYDEYIDMLSKELGDKIPQELQKDLGTNLKKLHDKLYKAGMVQMGYPSIPYEKVTAILGVSGDFISKVPQEIKDRVGNQLRLSAMSGDTVLDTAKKIAGEIRGYKSIFKSEETRAKLIARNEFHRINNIASWEEIQQIAQELGDRAIIWKIWNANMDERTRIDHREADGQRVKWDEPFIVGGEKLMYPQDPNGSAGNVINCRCWLTIEIEPKEEGNV